MELVESELEDLNTNFVLAERMAFGSQWCHYYLGSWDKKVISGIEFVFATFTG